MTTQNKTKILIVDDVEQNRLILNEILKNKYDIVEADDGDVCLDLLRTDKDIDLVLLDILMPRVDGFAVLDAMSKDKNISRPVIIVTGDNTSSLEIKALNSGAMDFLEKPYNPDIVRSRVDNIVTRKILEAKIIKAELSNAKEQLEAMVELVPDGIAICDIHPNGQVYMEFTNEYFKNFFSIDSDKFERLKNGEFSLTDISKIAHEEDRERILNALNNFKFDSAFSTIEFRVAADGVTKWVRASMMFMPHDNGVVRCHALIADITADREREAQVTAAFDELKYITSHDSLTQLFNRGFFCIKTEQLIKDNPDCSYTIVLCDIKNFKIVNDLFGNEKGDEILIHIAKKVKLLAGDNGTYGRLGSDKFAICIPTSECSPAKIVDDIDNWINSSEIIDYNVKTYLGLCDIDDRNVPIEIVCDRATMALKNAKLDYIKRYTYYDANMRQSIMDEEVILNEMEDALATDQFKLCYQPIFSISTGKPVSAEALVRWIHPTRGIIPPNKFIPVFENNKFITNLDKYVFEEACKFQRKRLDQGKKIIPISINFSRLDCYLPGICEDVLGLVKKYGLTTDMIKVEITESAYTEDKEQIVSVAEKLRSYGFSILMDDFGSGYSSLNILKDVKVDILKIDKTFVDDMADSDMGGAIVSSVVRMARLIGIDVIAEGVEQQNQIDFLRGIGCDIIQGYYYSKPLFEDEFSETLDKYINMEDGESVEIFRNNNVSIDRAWNSKEDINTIFDGLIGALGLYELNQDGTLEIIRVNDAYYELFGSSPQSVYSNLGGSFSKLTEESRHTLIETCSKAKYNSQISCCELCKYHEDGHIMWISCRVKYIGRNDKRDMFYILINDITERKNNEASKQLNEYASVFRTFFNAIFEFNPTKRTVTVLHSDGSLGFKTGSKFESSDFKKEFIDQTLYAESVEVFQNNKSKFDDTDELYVDRWDLKGSDGVTRPYERRLIKIKDSEDKIYLSCFVDMSGSRV